MATTVKIDISGVLPDGRSFQGFFRSKLSRNAIIDESFVGSYEWQEVVIKNGHADVHLLPNSILGDDTWYDYQIVARSGYGEKVVQQGGIIVPDSDCKLSDIITVPVIPEEQAPSYLNAMKAQASAQTAVSSAETAIGYASQAQSSAETAAGILESVQAVQTNITDTVVPDITQKQSDVSSMKDSVSGYVQEMNTIKSETEAYVEDAKEDIDESVTSGVSAINTAKGTAITAIDTESETKVAAVQSAGASAVSSVSTAENVAVSAVQDEGATQVSAVSGAGSTQIDAVQAEGSRQTGIVSASGESAKSAIQTLKNESEQTLNGLVSQARASALSAADDAQLAKSSYQSAVSSASSASNSASTASSERALAETAKADAQAFADAASASVTLAQSAVSTARTIVTEAEVVRVESVTDEGVVKLVTEEDISNLSSQVTAMQGQVNSAVSAASTASSKADAASLSTSNEATRATAAESAIATNVTSLQSAVTSAQGDIANLQTGKEDAGVCLAKSGGTMSGTITAGVSETIRRNNDAASVDIFGDTKTDGKGSLISVRGCSRGTDAGTFILRAGNGSVARNLYGDPTGTLTWGGQSISVTSDERMKRDIFSFDERTLIAWGDVNWTSFRFVDAVERKGDSARTHAGIIAQHVVSVFSQHGLDATELGILCYNESEDLWTVRYEEALALEAAYQRHRADKIEERISALETKHEIVGGV